MVDFDRTLVPDIFANDKVLYECSCGALKPLTSTYFCRHCLKMRCRDCVSHEVDSQYCQHCLEYIPTIDAKLKKNKCASCFQCPSCSHTLTTRVVIVQVSSTADPSQMTPKKVFYLLCTFCRWSSRDVGMPDQSAASGAWPEMEIPNAKRLESLFDYYRMVAQKEKMDKEKKRINPRTAIHLLDKYGISSSLSPKVTAQLRQKIFGWKSTSSGILDAKSPTEGTIDVAVATDEIEPLDTSYYYGSDGENAFDVTKQTNLTQRLSHLEIQGKEISSFYPQSKMLLVKRSLRCKECDHNLSKPEYNPSSIKFKIQLSAYYHIPELRIKTIPELKVGQETKIELTLQNPTPYLLHVTLLPNLKTESKYAKVVLPSIEIQLAPKDDTADLDVDQNLQSQFQDDPTVISFRKANKIGVLITMVPLEPTSKLRLYLKLKHDFVNTIIQTHGSGEREPQINWISHNMLLSLGSISK